MSDPHGTFSATIGSQRVRLPIVPIADDLAISLMMTIDLGVSFTVTVTAAADLARLLAPARPDVVVSVATLGIPVAYEVSRALGLDDYLIVQKSPKIHLRDALREPVTSRAKPGGKPSLTAPCWSAPWGLFRSSSRRPAAAGSRKFHRLGQFARIRTTSRMACRHMTH